MSNLYSPKTQNEELYRMYRAVQIGYWKAIQIGTQLSILYRMQGHPGIEKHTVTIAYIECMAMVSENIHYCLYRMQGHPGIGKHTLYIVYIECRAILVSENRHGCLYRMQGHPGIGKQTHVSIVYVI